MFRGFKLPFNKVHKQERARYSLSIYVSMIFANAGGERKTKVFETRFTFNDMKK